MMRRALVLLALVLAGCAAAPPETADNICAIFREHPSWYDHARASEQRWGTPIAVQMAFVRQESSFRHNARPPRDWLLGFIPWMRPSTAYGYAQAQNPVWGEYMDERGGLLSRRTRMRDALDFIGWYNDRTHRRLGISRSNARHLYLAYHEGHTGYRRQRWQQNATLDRAANRVQATARRYAQQLPACEAELRCRHFWEFGPFCEAP